MVPIVHYQDHQIQTWLRLVLYMVQTHNITKKEVGRVRISAGFKKPDETLPQNFGVRTSILWQMPPADQLENAPTKMQFLEQISHWRYTIFTSETKSYLIKRVMSSNGEWKRSYFLP